MSKKLDNKDTGISAKREIAEHKIVLENDEIIVMHSIGTFPNGSRDAVMYVGLKRDGKIYKSETGSTPIPDKS